MLGKPCLWFFCCFLKTRPVSTTSRGTLTFQSHSLPTTKKNRSILPAGLHIIVGSSVTALPPHDRVKHHIHHCAGPPPRPAGRPQLRAAGLVGDDGAGRARGGVVGA